MSSASRGAMVVVLPAPMMSCETSDLPSVSVPTNFSTSRTCVSRRMMLVVNSKIR